MHINKNSKDACIWICEILSKAHVDFSISGGFAAKVYGSPRPLYDIDIDLCDEDFYKIAKIPSLSQYITFGPTRFIDEKWSILLLTLNYNKQYIDICGSDSAKIYSHIDKQWILYPFDLESSISTRLFGGNIKIISKELLLQYKSHLNRDEDIEDVTYLRSQTNKR